jgi:hypothetical protein
LQIKPPPIIREHVAPFIQGFVVGHAPPIGETAVVVVALVRFVLAREITISNFAVYFIFLILPEVSQKSPVQPGRQLH